MENSFTICLYFEANNFFLIENVIITDRSLDPYVKESGLIFSSNDQTDELNKKFIIWLVLNKLNISFW